MNLLLEGSSRMPVQTNMAQVFDALDGAQYAYDWLVTNIDCVATSEAGLPAILLPVERARSIVVSGKELTAIFERYPMQFVWGVFSGIPRARAVGLTPSEVAPTADGNSCYWEAVQLTPQHPLAEVEIVCWDASATLVISRSVEISAAFVASFPEAVDLDAYNARVSSRGGV